MKLRINFVGRLDGAIGLNCNFWETIDVDGLPPEIEKLETYPARSNILAALHSIKNDEGSRKYEINNIKKVVILER